MARKRKRLNRRLFTYIFSGVGITLSLYFIIQAVNDILVSADLSDKVKVTEEELARLQSQNESLINQRAKLEDPEYIKNYARAVHLLTKDGEQIFHITSNDE